MKKYLNIYFIALFERHSNEKTKIFFENLLTICESGDIMSRKEAKTSKTSRISVLTIPQRCVW